ncbi:MAG TPA: hypothetical protein VGO79_12205 [Thermoanaerobaculia bacterium]
MPTIAVNLGTVVSSFEDLPFATYLGEIVKITLLPPRQAGKFAQLLISYLVIDGDLVGRRQSQFMSLSPNAMGFVKGFFAKFGLGEIPNLIVDDDSNELTEPDLYGSKVIFRVSQDKKDPERTRVGLVSVEEFGPGFAEAPAPVRSTVKPPKAAALPNMVEAPAETPAEAKAAAKAARIAAAQAALEAAAAEDEDEPEEETVAATVPARTAAPRPSNGTAAAPVRRTLR